ncbi:hypothetical protein [Agrobacterium rosae]
MTEADRKAVGLVGFAAWKSSSAFENTYLDPVVIERVRGEFETFAQKTQCDIAVAEIDGLLAGWGARADGPNTSPTSGSPPTFRVEALAGCWSSIS